MEEQRSSPAIFMESDNDTEDQTGLENVADSSQWSCEASDDESYCPSAASDETTFSPSRKRKRSRGSSGAEDGSRSRSPIGWMMRGWKTREYPDVGAPQRLRFNPKRTPGAQPPLTTGKPTPREIFTKYFDEDVLLVLCNHTNKYASQKMEGGRRYAWTDVTPEEMRLYIGLMLYMSVLRLPRVSDYWRQKTIFSVTSPATIMSRERFQHISGNVQMSDPEEDAQNDQRRGTADHDRLDRVRPLLEILRGRCMSLYHPRQHICVDERMVATNARTSARQYTTDKTSRWGQKFFVLADANGYTVDFKLYEGKSAEASGKGLSFDVVAGLVNGNFLGTGYIIYCDSFYTSPLLFRHLSAQGFGACGTYRQGRVGDPTTQENALDKKSPRGSIRWIREDDLLFVKWMDTKEVSLCSTVHSVYSGETVLRWRKTGDKYRRVAIPSPTVVAEYNKYMGGVDTDHAHASDQMLGTNSVHRKTMRWPKTMLQHCVDIAVTNSYILYKELLQEERYTRQMFQEELCAQLLVVPPRSAPQRSQKPPNQQHIPVAISSGQPKSKSKAASEGRRRCVVCKKQTPWRCDACQQVLCLQVDRNCFAAHHSGEQGLAAAQAGDLKQGTSSEGREVNGADEEKEVVWVCGEESREDAGMYLQGPQTQQRTSRDRSRSGLRSGSQHRRHHKETIRS